MTNREAIETLRKMKKCAEKSGGCECRYCSLHVACQKAKEAIDLAVAALIYKDPACAEPVVKLSGYSRHQGLGCYRVVTDSGTEFYVDKLPKGRYTVTEELQIDRPGAYEQGVATITCTYAPEFAGNTAGRKIQVSDAKN